MPRPGITIGHCHLFNQDYAKRLFGNDYKKYLNMTCYEAGLLIARDACNPSPMVGNPSKCNFAYTLLKNWIDTSTKEMRKIIKTQIYNSNIKDPAMINSVARLGLDLKTIVKRKADIMWKRDYEQQIIQSKINKIDGITYRIMINPANPWIDYKDESNLVLGQSQLTNTDRVRKIDLLLDELSKMNKKHTIRRNWRKAVQDQKLLIKFSEAIKKAKSLEEIQKAIADAERAGIPDIKDDTKSLYDIAREKEQKILEAYKDPVFLRSINLRDTVRNRKFLKKAKDNSKFGKCDYFDNPGAQRILGEQAAYRYANFKRNNVDVGCRQAGLDLALHACRPNIAITNDGDVIYNENGRPINIDCNRNQKCEYVNDSFSISRAHIDPRCRLAEGLLEEIGMDGLDIERITGTDDWRDKVYGFNPKLRGSWQKRGRKVNKAEYKDVEKRRRDFIKDLQISR